MIWLSVEMSEILKRKSRDFTPSKNTQYKKFAVIIRVFVSLCPFLCRREVGRDSVSNTIESL